MASLVDTLIFNQPSSVVESWYWAFKSADLKKAKVKPLNFLGRELAVYRGEDGVVRAVDAFCPHMGAHFLAEGKVDGKGLRCFFHAWKFDEKGQLEDIPCRQTPGVQAGIKHHPVCEQYGVIWIYTGENPSHPVHYVPELEGVEVAHSFGNQFEKGCHPSVVLVNAIDAHHFNSVHNLPVRVEFDCQPQGPNMVQFNNTTPMPQTKWYLLLFQPFLQRAVDLFALLYLWQHRLCHRGSRLFTLPYYLCPAPHPRGQNPRPDDFDHPQTAHKTKLGWLNAFNPIILFATMLVGNYFATGDTKLFQTIKFKFKRPIKRTFDY